MKKAGAKSYDFAAKKMRPLPLTGAGKEVLRLSCGAMHPKGTCSASLHCVGIAPYESTTGKYP